MTVETDTDRLTPRELGAWRGMLRAHRDLSARLDSELLSAHELPFGAYEVLLHLDDAGGCLRMGELAERLLLSRSGLTRGIDRLERAGLVERRRCPEDGRGSLAGITDAGREQLAAARPTHLAGVRTHFLSRLSATEQRTLGAVFDRLAAPAGPGGN